MDLRDYLDSLRNLSELIDVRKPVSTKFELAALTAKLDGKEAVLFDNVKESNMRVTTNVCVKIMAET